MNITINIPDDINFNLSEFDLKMLIGISLYEKGIMSTGFASEILNIDKADFILSMPKYGKSLFNIGREELKKDLEVAEKLL